MGGWFRAYDEALDDPKVQRLTGDLFKTLFNIWCVARRHGGFLPAMADLAFMLRLSPEDTASRMASLVAAGLIDDEGGVLQPHNWGGRQYQSDDSRPRVAKSRAKNRAPVEDEANPDDRYGNGRYAVTVTPSESESETDSDSSSSSSVVVPFAPRASPAPKDDDDEIYRKLKEIFGTRAEDRVCRSGVAKVREWIAEGCDPDRDVREALLEVARKLKTPLRSFAAPFLADQVRIRRDARLASQRARAARGEPEPRTQVFVIDGSAEWRAWVAAGHKPGLNIARDGARTGWWFASAWPPSAEPARAAE
jgi:hypothetical protein